MLTLLRATLTPHTHRTSTRIRNHTQRSIGSLFYAIYFFVSFPMFMRIDETPGDKRWTLPAVRRADRGWL